MGLQDASTVDAGLDWNERAHGHLARARHALLEESATQAHSIVQTHCVWRFSAFVFGNLAFAHAFVMMTLTNVRVP